MKKTAIFSISSLGLGHAARTAPIVRSYLDTHDVHIISDGKALRFLRDEFAGTNATFYRYKDYPPLERGRGSWKFYWYMIVDALSMPFIIWRETAFIRDLVTKLDPEFIFSDGRYGSYAGGVPSFILSHQIQFSLPRGFGAFQWFVDWFNYRSFKKFDALIIPDYEDPEHNLAGNLARHPMLARLNHRYVGILTLSPARLGAVKDIDVLFTISGYLDEHRPTFINSLIDEAKKIPGKKVFVIGDPSGGEKTAIAGHDIEIYPMVSGALRQDLFSRAKCIVSRSGYTTIMDLAELGVSGLLIPTPGQTEQEYLAKYLGGKGYFLTSSPDDSIDLGPLRRASSLGASFKAPWKTIESIRRVRELVSEVISWYK